MTSSDQIPSLLRLAPGMRALVTAGAGGIGRAVADALIAAGLRVHICDVDPVGLVNFRAQHPSMGATLADVGQEAEVDALFEAVAQDFDGLDILVNNAGIAGPTGAVEDIMLDDWNSTLNVCLTGQFLCVRRAAPMIRAAGGGLIVNLFSAAGRFGYAWRTPYSSAKWGVIGLTQSLAKELGRDNIRVNAILPGIVAGARMDGVIRARAAQMGMSAEDCEREYLARISLRRMVDPEDIAAMVLFPCQPWRSE